MKVRVCVRVGVCVRERDDGRRSSEDKKAMCCQFDMTTLVQSYFLFLLSLSISLFVQSLPLNYTLISIVFSTILHVLICLPLLLLIHLLWSPLMCLLFVFQTLNSCLKFVLFLFSQLSTSFAHTRFSFSVFIAVNVNTFCLCSFTTVVHIFLLFCTSVQLRHMDNTVKPFYFTL